MEKRPESDHGWFANAKDVEGNRFGVYELQPKMWNS
jgi:predicted enzyme related to lactoylglutathione lyase